MNATDVSRKVAAGLHALETVGKIAKTLVPDGVQGRADQAIAIVSLIAALVDKVGKGLAGDINIGDIEAELAKLTSDLSGNDAARKLARDARFPQEG